MTTLKISLLLALVIGVCFGGVATAHAQVAPQTCSTGVWRTMEDRARLETQREIMQNQNLIFKADSVLSYTCFDRFAAHGARHLGRLFTHTTYWNGTAILKEAGEPPRYFGMGGAVDGAVRLAMTNYIQGSFSHSPLGGRGADRLGLASPTITEVKAGGADYSCGEMSRVWAVAKCMNFMHTSTTAGTDGFYPFKDLAVGPEGGQNVAGYSAKGDVRSFPTGCGSVATPGGTTATVAPFLNGWDGVYNSSRNSNGTLYDTHYQFGTPTGIAFTDVRKFVDPAASCQTILTGVQIILSPNRPDGASVNDGPDGVCTNPGCSYINGTCTKSAAAGGGP